MRIFATALKRKRNFLRDNKDEFRTRLVHGWNVYASKTGDRKTIADDAASAGNRPPKYATPPCVLDRLRALCV